MKYHASKPLFSGKTKMAELILRNYTLLSLLPRFDITLGFGEKSIATLCHERGIDLTLFLMICNIHSMSDYTPSDETIAALDIDSLVEYLSRSHTYYTKERITSIERKLSQIKGECANEQHELVVKFFDEYCHEVVRHFEYEDKQVFPYIKTLVTGETPTNFNIDQYEDNHENIDDKLSDLKSIIIKYLPESYPSAERIDILNDIFLFEDDLEKHTRIEERVLIPLVKNIERSHGEK